MSGLVEWAIRAGWLVEAISRSESPLEALFLCSMYVHTEKGLPSFGPNGSGAAWAVSVQHDVSIENETYRIDVALMRGKVCVAVELDGHEFHERSPAQVERDNRRSRALQSTGWFVLRFNGREVWRDPNGSVASLAKDLERMFEEDKRRRRMPEYDPLTAASARGDVEEENRLLRHVQERALARARARGAI